MSIQEIVKYATSTPHNTNPNVLKTMLEEEINNNDNSNCRMLKRKGYEQDVMIPAGIFGESAYYRVWIEIPNISKTIGGFIGGTYPTNFLYELREAQLRDLSETEGVPIIAYLDNVGKEAMVVIITKEFAVDDLDGLIFKPGIYFISGLLSTHSIYIFAHSV